MPGPAGRSIKRYADPTRVGDRRAKRAISTRTGIFFGTKLVPLLQLLDEPSVQQVHDRLAASLVQPHALFVREFESASRVVGAIHHPESMGCGDPYAGYTADWVTDAEDAFRRVIRYPPAPQLPAPSRS